MEMQITIINSELLEPGKARKDHQEWWLQAIQHHIAEPADPSGFSIEIGWFLGEAMVSIVDSEGEHNYISDFPKENN